MLLVVQKGIRGGTCHAINQYAKGNNKNMKDYDKMKDLIRPIRFWSSFHKNMNIIHKLL